MTRPTQKRRERFFVEQAGKLLGKAWILEEEREHPDFIVTEGEQRFGLEVCEIFTGPQDRAGSVMKRMESSVRWQLKPSGANTRPSRQQRSAFKSSAD